MDKGVDIPKFPHDVQYVDRLKGLSLAIHTLNQLNDNQHFNLKNIANEFDHSEKFVLSVIEFLKDIEWLIQDKNGKYIVTEQAKIEMSYLNDRSKQSQI